MVEFKDITLADKELIQSFTLNSQRRNCDLSFANLCFAFMPVKSWPT